MSLNNPNNQNNQKISLGELYSKFFNSELNKLSEQEREWIKKDLKNPEMSFRLKKFITAACELAEKEFDGQNSKKN
jgi:hypothetical protein